ncbi:MAG: NADH:flavin oxidoreductase [Gemmatimonadetes bacterium]|nr:NADH:flavin oxidoreductase [Gemmatimonadota bacterium]
MSLFAPLELRGVTLRNRIVVSPMCQYSSNDGFADDWHLVHLGQFATGGASLVLTEAIAVTEDGRISPQDLGIWKDEHVEMLARITRFVSAQGAAMGVQLAHAGRKASTRRPWEGRGAVTVEQGGWTPIYAPSAIPFADDWQVPQELDEQGIAQLQRSFARAAERALEAGMTVIELHAAHGYLLHEFLSPLSNVRTDRYGGDFAGRTRMLLGTVDAVRAVWPERNALFVRVSATDWTEGGWTPDETVELAKLLGAHGVDLVDCSSGGNVARAQIPLGPGYQVPFAARVKREGGMRSGAVGMITEPAQADAIIRNGEADVVFLARELLRDPHFALRAARELGVEGPWPVQYERAKT